MANERKPRKITKREREKQNKNGKLWSVKVCFVFLFFDPYMILCAYRDNKYKLVIRLLLLLDKQYPKNNENECETNRKKIKNYEIRIRKIRKKTVMNEKKIDLFFLISSTITIKDLNLNRKPSKNKQFPILGIRNTHKDKQILYEPDMSLRKLISDYFPFFLFVSFIFTFVFSYFFSLFDDEIFHSIFNDFYIST